MTCNHKNKNSKEKKQLWKDRIWSKYWARPREREERSTSAHTRIESTMQRTCVTTATTEKERIRKRMAVVILTDLTTQVECVKIAIWQNTTKRER